MWPLKTLIRIPTRDKDQKRQEVRNWDSVENLVNVKKQNKKETWGRLKPPLLEVSGVI